MTINAGRKELLLLDRPTVEKAAEVTAAALLRGARGNSGVILSLLFRGFFKGLKGKATANGKDLAAALTLGVDAAYKAVMKPTEGTILTVARVAAESATKLAQTTDDFKIIFNDIVTKAKEALETTPNLLPVLKKAGVVDAGGMGLVIIFEGMQSVFNNDKVIEPTSKPEKKQISQLNNAIADFDGEIKFAYCTEFIVDKAPNCPNSLKLRALIETMGDSVVCVDDDSIIKIHVHTNNPGDALQAGLKYGQLINIKIENMKEQHQAKINEATRAQADEQYQPVDPERPYGFVSVAAGAGLQDLFFDLGVDKIVSGGQTMNPSTDDILRAIEATPAETVFVLPNNKNIIMAAEQAVKLSDRRVCVLQTRTIPQGISAMLAFDSALTYSENRVNMTKQFDLVQTGLITFAARDSDFDGHSIKKGEILGLENGKLAFTERDINKALVRLVKALSKKVDGSFITIIYGSDVTDQQAESAYNLVIDRFGDDYEVNLINGGQPVYYYVLSVE